jgi:hypothetical protein
MLEFVLRNIQTIRGSREFGVNKSPAAFVEKHRVSLALVDDNSDTLPCFTVRVAPKNTEMVSVSIRKNQSIFVFVVTTIIYFPPGFVTVSTPYFKELNVLTRGMEFIFGMHLFDTTDPG